MRTLAVFFGGKSNEREISVITGLLAVNLLRDVYRVVPVYLGEESGVMYTSDEMRSVADFRAPKKFHSVRLEGRKLVRADRRNKTVAVLDAAFICCHGGMGEDGTLSALLDWNGVPNASPGTPVSAVFMNKEFSQIAARGLGIPTVESFTVGEREWVADETAVLARAQQFGYPVIVKPSRLGSSIGVKVARNGEEMKKALGLAFRLDDGALSERYLPNKRDINCAAYRRGGEIVVSACEEVFSDGEILSFSEKYEGTGARKSVFPAELPAETAEEIRAYTRLLYESFHVRGIVRADFLISEGRAYFNELNTVPGSLACYLFGESLTRSRDFLVSLVEEALAAPPQTKETLISGILDANVFSGGKGCKRR